MNPKIFFVQIDIIIIIIKDKKSLIIEKDIKDIKDKKSSQEIILRENPYELRSDKAFSFEIYFNKYLIFFTRRKRLIKVQIKIFYYIDQTLYRSSNYWVYFEKLERLIYGF